MVLIAFPPNIVAAAPIVLTNGQNVATPAPFQQMVSVNMLKYSGYAASNLQNIEFFYADGTLIPSWLESGSSSTTAIWWLSIANGIGANSSLTVYMGFALQSVNLFDGVTVGEAPQLSATYGQYDNGAKVFTYYNANPADTTGWTIAGSAGLSTAAPSGSYFKAPNAYYANSANGDYMYKPVSGLAPGTVLTFWVYTTGLGDLFFMCNSSGAGQMARLDGRNTNSDWAGQAATASWTSWSGPSSGLLEPANTWFKIDVVIGATSSTMYIAPADTAIGTVGTEANAYTFTNNGNYLGLVGDALGSTYITYWNGFVIRAYPPSGVMPIVLINSVVAKSTPSSKLRTFRIQSLPGYGKSLDTFTDAGGNTFSNPIPITITNKQDAYVPAGFQQKMSLQPLLGVNSEWSNVAFTDRYNNELHSWVESRGSPATIWVLLPFGIGPNSSVTIYMWIGDSSVTWDSFRGEAPNLSTTYGQHDNGADVFSFYDNFAGTALSSKWTTGGNYSGSVDNGLTLTSSADSGGIYALHSATSGVIETYWEQTASQTFKVIFLNQLSIGTTWYADGYNSRQVAGQTTDQNLLEKQVGGSTTVMTTGLPETQLSAYYIVGLEWNGANGLLNETLNYNSISSATDTTYASMVGISLMTWAGATNIIKWVRVRAYPPSGVMPSVTVSTSLIPDISSVLITLTNTQSTSTPVGLQVPLDINWSNYQSSLAPDVGNVRFYDSSNNEMYAWLESGNSNTATTSKVWLKLTQSIPAGGYITVTMKFLSTSTEYDGVYWGQAPQLSATYGQYDNGAKVFSNYWNFAGTTMPSGWNLGDATASVNNGLVLDVTGAASYAYGGASYGTAISPPFISEGLFSSGSDVIALGLSNNPTPSATTDQFDPSSWASTGGTGGWYIDGDVLWKSGTPTLSTAGNYIEQIVASSSTAVSASILTTSYTVDNSLAASSTSWDGNGKYLTIGYSGAATIGTIYWLRVRAYPPDGVMPIVAYGSTFTAAASVGRYLTSIADSAGNLFKNFFKVYVTNTQNVDTVKPFQKLLTLPAFSGVNPDWSNVMFTDNNFTELPSWVEVRGDGLTPSNIWVRLPDGIPANETVTIYGWVGGSDVTWTSFRGEASQLSASFGAHDNIGTVMNPGLLFQIYYDATGMVSSIPYLQDIYEASLKNGTTLPYGALVASTPPFIGAPSVPSSQDVNGTTQPYTLFYYNCSGGTCLQSYTGGILPPNPPIPSETGCGYNAWALKAIGFVRVKTPGTKFGVFVDDSVFLQIASMSSGSLQSETSWLSGMLQAIAVINSWIITGGVNHSSAPVTGTGDFRMMMLYSNSHVCAAAIALYSNVDPDYYSASPLPNGVDPTVSVYSACTVLAPPKPIKQVRVPPSQNPGIPLSANKDNLFLVQNPCPVL